MWRNERDDLCVENNLGVTTNKSIVCVWTRFVLASKNQIYIFQMVLGRKRHHESFGEYKGPPRLTRVSVFEIPCFCLMVTLNFK